VPDEPGEQWNPMPAGVSVERVLKPEEYTFNTGELLAA